ncbi:DUF6485 family protein [Desulfoscipio geothermicus]|uniref:Cytosolic protein n=1 Tax=Desulfoscipio geothermicus DSM 3669 TaxID=1121426 RepID=A0A1I6EJX2_9FIRM|nr:DUF6485 family protein [Desulfoscipio geothermicus]SFR17762.1 hypothetical protein SAMN05660706_14911 [Desulfoscipio geothermicus DSM 3669]
MDCKKDKNIAGCTCTYEPCPKKGVCCECIAYHRKNGEAPGCLFPPEVEKTYDRSLARLARCYTK